MQRERHAGQPRTLWKSIDQLQALKTLNLQGCKKLTSLPESIGVLQARGVNITRP